MMLKYSTAQLVTLNSCIMQPLCLAVINKLWLLRSRPQYIHRGFRRRFVVAGSEPLSSWSCAQTVPGSLRHHNKPRTCIGNLKAPVCVDSVILLTPPASSSNAPTFMLLNTRSLNNKAPLIHDIINDRKTDFVCLTETWQNQQDFFTLSQVTPPGYVYLQKPRSLGRGGGLAVIHKAEIPIKQLPVVNTT